MLFSARVAARRSFSARLATHRRSVGAGYVVILTMATPVIGIAMTMIGIPAGQVAKSPAIDHYGLFGSPRRKIDPRRAMALMLIMAALLLVALG